MFASEPAKDSPLFGTPNFISTPHLGASTSEAQVNVAIQVAEQMSDFLLLGGVTNAINMPSLYRRGSAAAEALHGAGGEAREAGRADRSVRTSGRSRSRSRARPPQLNQKPITGAVLAGLMGTYSQTVNMVNAPVLAKERGLDVREVRHDREGNYHTLVAVEVGTSKGPRRVAGTLFGNSGARLVEMFGVEVEAELEADDDLHRQHRRAGFHRQARYDAWAKRRINIATFHLGRRAAGGEAVALVAVDGDVPAAVVQKLCALDGVREVVPLRF